MTDDLNNHKHKHYWLTGEVALIQDPDGGKWFVTRWFGYPKIKSDADSCYQEITLSPAQET